MNPTWIIGSILIMILSAVVGVSISTIRQIGKRTTDLERRMDVIAERVDNLAELNRALNEQIKTITAINTKIIERIDARKGSLDTLNETIGKFLVELVNKGKS